jgi:hypothetical protein
MHIVKPQTPDGGECVVAVADLSADASRRIENIQ